MQELQGTVPVFKTPQELDRAVRNYQVSDLKGFELFRQWLAIRNASLEQSRVELAGDRIPGDDSY
ncbi:hypothetical protein [Stenomitos frigidus]|uniref:Uncharacterized protein n=1 Tax=Stenomitos frigidus ULC18 TaxID=2107698 RepID=A0A2T1E7W0_9CYAN|nr:hypothetical protein [Stenomitos frigidus]PSB28820.1 hypothetical protein C7B82_12595 [Stenomitos frigidus ULC18]